MMRSLALSAAVAVTLIAAPYAHAESDQQQAVNDARNVIDHIRGGHDDIARETRELLHRARAVVIVPQLVKGGFIFGAEGGNGVMVARGPKGDWSDPAFYTIGAGSFGFQIGVEVSRVVLIIMNERALNAVLESKIQLGAEAGLAVATVGAGGKASTTTAVGADIYTVAESKGLFGGLAIEGGVMAPEHDWDDAYYGRNVSARDIILRRTVHNPGATGLRQALAGF